MLRFRANVLLFDTGFLSFGEGVLLATTFFFRVLFDTVEELLLLYRSTVLLATAFFIVLRAIGLEIRENQISTE